MICTLKSTVYYSFFMVSRSVRLKTLRVACSYEASHVGIPLVGIAPQRSRDGGRL